MAKKTTKEYAAVPGTEARAGSVKARVYFHKRKGLLLKIEAPPWIKIQGKKKGE